MSSPKPFHRIFGYSWIDFFDGTDIEVETEVDLSVRLQFLDLVIIRKGLSQLPRRMPDGLEELTTYTLMSFKSYQEALDADAVLELVAHFVNYRKRVSPALDRLLPRGEFQLVAVTVRSPLKLSGEMSLIPVMPGVYDVRGFSITVRVLVVNELPKEEHNAMLHLFSPDDDLIGYGRGHYRPHSEGTSSLLYQLLTTYREDPTMSEKMKEFVRQTIREMLNSLPPEERLKGLPAEERLKGLPAEERLKGLPAEERLKGLPAEERLKGLSPDEVMKALPAEVLEAVKRQIKSNGTTPEAD